MKLRDGPQGPMGEAGRPHRQLDGNDRDARGHQQLLEHVDALIERQQYELDHADLRRGKPRMRMDRAKYRIGRLRQLRYEIANRGRPDPVLLDGILQDMRSLGW